jgi:hypothetical protein
MICRSDRGRGPFSPPARRPFRRWSKSQRSCRPCSRRGARGLLLPLLLSGDGRAPARMLGARRAPSPTPSAAGRRVELGDLKAGLARIEATNDGLYARETARTPHPPALHLVASPPHKWGRALERRPRGDRLTRMRPAAAGTVAGYRPQEAAPGGAETPTEGLTTRPYGELTDSSAVSRSAPRA